MKLNTMIHGVSRWGKPELTRSGDVNVAVDLARASGSSTVWYANINEEDIASLTNLYDGIDFVHWSEYIHQADDVVFIPQLETRTGGDSQDTLNFYEMVKSVDHIVCNIVRDKDFYIQSLAEDTTLKISAREVLASASLIVLHDSTLEADYPESWGVTAEQISVGQILFYDPALELDSGDHERVAGRGVSYGRASMFKGPQLWLEAVNFGDLNRDQVLVCPISMNPKTRNEFFGTLYGRHLAARCNIISSFDEYVESPRPTIIDTAFDMEELSQQEWFKSSEISPVTHDYRYGISGDYCVIEYTQIESLYRGMRLKWIKQSLETMTSRRNAFNTAKKLNLMSLEEQREVIASGFNAEIYLARLQVIWDLKIGNQIPTLSSLNHSENLVD